MTFQEPEVELDPEEDGESYPQEPSIVDVETWLDWQAHQLDMPYWWMELTAIPGVEDPWVAILGGETQSARKPRFLPLGKKYHRVEGEDETAHHVHQMGCHLGLREGQPRGYEPEAPTSSTSFGRMEPSLGDQPVEQDMNFMEATTQTVSQAMSDVELTRHITPPDRTEEENQYVLVITALIRQLNLETADVDLGELETAPQGRDAFQNPHMAAVFLGSTRRVISSQGTTVKVFSYYIRKT